MTVINFLKEMFSKSGGESETLEPLNVDIDSQVQTLVEAASTLMGWSHIMGQKNTMGVLNKAIKKIEYSGIEERIEPDKMKRLIDLSSEFSSEEMQEYVAWILAGEYNTPWSYSLQTMSIIKNLSKHEMEIFRKFCWMVINWEYVFWNFFQAWHKNLKKLYEKNIGYNNYLYMQELGIFSWSDSAAALLNETNKKRVYTVMIWLKGFLLQYTKEIQLSHSLLTHAGKELYKLIEPVYDADLFEMIKEEFLRQWFEEYVYTSSESQ